MEISEFEKKRAANLIWNGAQDYSVEPGFRVFDADGRADVYWNCIVGAAHKHYDFQKLELFYDTFHETVNQAVYESLFWLAVENAVYEAEKQLRPVFPYLRKVYAARKVEELHGQFSLEDSAGQRLLAITLGHFRRALGEDANLPDTVDVKLLDEIEACAGLDTDQFIAHLSRTLSMYFTYHKPGQEAEKKTFFLPSLSHLLRRDGRVRGGKLSPLRKLSFGYGDHLREYGSEVLDQSHLSVAFAKYTAQSDEGLREYIENSFGRPIRTKQQILELQKEYCYGNHTDARLYFTDGSYTEEMLRQGYAGKMKREGIDQARKNEEVYNAQSAQHRMQIEKLTERIRNVLITHREDSTVRSLAGRIRAEKIWRALYLEDARVFTRLLPGSDNDITVDLLLDASTSQLHRQEVVAAQGYMIAESLTRCGVPVRVSAFCSLNGYTVINIFRDYAAEGDNRNIFRFFTAGANRDGLAIRLAAGMLRENTAQHRILIILSDDQPNDVLKVRTESGGYADYADETALSDTAEEVHKARMQGITVLNVYTGPDKNLSAARKIYGRDFVRIRSLDMFADTVGSMLQEQIRQF